MLYGVACCVLCNARGVLFVGWYFLACRCFVNVNMDCLCSVSAVWSLLFVVVCCCLYFLVSESASSCIVRCALCVVGCVLVVPDV